MSQVDIKIEWINNNTIDIKGRRDSGVWFQIIKSDENNQFIQP